ncbi:MAG: hypothetical protein WEC79_01280 [Thermomicrobiales bacterium]
MQDLLSHVLWIGGPPDCGKTSVAKLIADRHGLQEYYFDRHEIAHFARATAEAQPALWAAHPDRITVEQRWLGSSPDVMARDTIASWSERFEMALDDLLALPDTPGIVAEGSGFFPELVAPLIDGPRRAIWLVPSEPFKLASVARRRKPGNRHDTSDPERATHNLTQRDLLMTAHIRRTAAEHGLQVVEVDGAEGVDAVVSRIEEHFALVLPALYIAVKIART